MAVEERARHELYQRLEATVGQDGAETLMALLPPVGWADVATRHDLAELDGRLEARIDAVGVRIDLSEQRILQTMTWRLVQMLVAVVGIVLAVIVPFVA